jgi:predicted glycoside hydrolase/deacetylase ChbG (UPF0249 family)
MKIITNADDFGFSSDSVAATIDCFEKGALTSATIMPKMPATAEAIGYARSHREFSCGVHLTFAASDSDTGECSVADPRDLPTLALPNGHFRPSPAVRLMALAHRISVREIELEATEQLALLRDAGLQISHADSHGHLHKFAPFREALKTVLPRFGIRKVRNVQDVYLRKPFRSPTYWFGGYWRRKIMADFITTDHFYMPTSSAFDARWSTRIIDRMRGPSLEIGVHPGYSEAWRDEERRAIIEFGEMAKSAGQNLVNWYQI